MESFIVVGMVLLVIAIILGGIFVLRSKSTVVLALSSSISLLAGLFVLLYFSIHLAQVIHKSQLCEASSQCFDESGSIYVADGLALGFGCLVLLFGIAALVKTIIVFNKAKTKPSI